VKQIGVLDGWQNRTDLASDVITRPDQHGGFLNPILLWSKAILHVSGKTNHNNVKNGGGRVWGGGGGNGYSRNLREIFEHM